MLTNKVRILTPAARKRVGNDCFSLDFDEEKRDGDDFVLLTSISPLLVKEVTWKGT